MMFTEADGTGFREVEIGHNKPPVDLSTLRQTLEDAHGALERRRDELVGAEGRVPSIDDDDSAGKVGDYIKQIATAIKEAEGARVAAKEPFMEGGRVVDGFFTKGIKDVLDALKRRVEAKLGAYLRAKAEAERRAREEAARKAREEEEARRNAALAAEASARNEAELQAAIEADRVAREAEAQRLNADKEASAKPAELSRTRGDYGSVSSLRTTWEYEVVDFERVPRQYLMLNEAAIKAHVKARLKNKPPADVPGLRFFESTNAVVR